MEQGLMLKVFDSRMKKAYQMELEDYVKHAVAFAMPADFPLEALKSQAVCCRTIAVRRMRIFGGSGCTRYPEYDVCTDPGHCQGFSDKLEEIPEGIKKAVEETSGLILTYNGNPVEAFYHDTCGGYTEDSENVLGNKISYLRKVECGFCSDSPHYVTRRIITIKNLKKKLGVNFDSAAGKVDIKGIFEEIKTTGAGRIKRIKVGDREFSGEEIKELLSINSNKFNWKVVAIALEIMGKGHGLGMCQYGARGMALKGQDFVNILKHYFTGTEVERIKTPSKDNPLILKKIAVDPGKGSEDDLCGPMGLSEGFINYEMARALREILTKEGAKVILTRNNNEKKDLMERIRVINDFDPDLLISLQQSFLKPDRERYVEIFYLPGDKEGKRLAECIKEAFISDLKVQAVSYEADLFLLRESKCPGVMIFTSNLNCPQEEKRISEEKYRKNVAETIFSGIILYYYGLTLK
ncbi:stage II sporulation protein D [Thermovenabulum sp.]|uniref:stage II sporulation protein D n=1 Tax=Thermovenabulum sp. TaxID=3100335 RepID=UPI003C7DFA2F